MAKNKKEPKNLSELIMCARKDPEQDIIEITKTWLQYTKKEEEYPLSQKEREQCYKRLYNDYVSGMFKIEFTYRKGGKKK